MDSQRFYFQTIAQKFIELRGAPFFLSSNELSLIEKWEAAGIPLRVVLEGIQSSFLLRRQNHGGTGTRRRIRSLSFCDSFVKQSFTLYKERAVGRRPPQAVKTDKKQDIRTAVAQFLEDIPQQVAWLESSFMHVKEILTDCPEEDLERAEENIEALLVAHASPEDQEEAKKETAAAFPDEEKEDFQRLFHLTLIKRMRSKYKIPYVAPFLY
ncbi:MAG: hypothetical protein MUP98_10770 [Candidatus Aminicenantes bacterium]|nr:hypothetical protein [Candidatus Aminicenantes bacterium]